MHAYNCVYTHTYRHSLSLYIYIYIYTASNQIASRMTCLDVFVEGRAIHLVMPYMDTDLKKVIEDLDMPEVVLHVLQFGCRRLDFETLESGNMSGMSLFG